MRKWGAIGLIVLLVGFAGLAVLLTRGGNDANQLDIYFFNPTSRRMEAEARTLRATGDFHMQAIGHLHSGPARSDALHSTWPHMLAPTQEDLIGNVKLEDETLYVFFLPVFHDMAPLEQSLFKAAFIHTMNGLATVSEVILVVTDDHDAALEMLMMDLSEYEPEAYDEEHMPYMPLVIYDRNHAGVLLDPLDPPISPNWIDDYTFNYLHFVDATGTGLVIESYFAEAIDRGQVALAEQALELLIAGPRYEGAVSVIPAETRIINLDIIETDMYVNLSSEFVSRFSGSYELANLMIHSIVNTLIAETHAPTRVFFMIETQQLEEFHGVTDFHTYFVQDNTLLLSYIEAMEDTYEYNGYEPEAAE